MPKKNYKPIREGDRFTIGEWDEGYKALIMNDGICTYYWWDTEEEAQAAATAYNKYTGSEWLGQHGYGNDIYYLDTPLPDKKMERLYRLFGAVRESAEDEQ